MLTSCWSGERRSKARRSRDALVPVGDGPVAKEMRWGAAAGGNRAGGAGLWSLGRSRRTLRARAAHRARAKREAEHVGAAAREARRARRITELREDGSPASGGGRSPWGGVAGIARRRATLDEELAGLPSSERFRQRSTRHGCARGGTGLAWHDRAVAQAREAADAEVAADAERREHAASTACRAGPDEPVLDRMRQASAELAGVVAAVAHAWARQDE